MSPARRFQVRGLPNFPTIASGLGVNDKPIMNRNLTEPRNFCGSQFDCFNYASNASNARILFHCTDFNFKGVEAVKYGIRAIHLES